MRTDRGIFMLATVFGVLMAPAASAQSAAGARIVLEDALGRTVALPGPARRIVSLTPSATEILFAVGAGDSVVGVTSYCNFPAETASKTKVGGFSGKTVSAESIVALKPDLVVISGGMHVKILGLLEAVGIRCYAVEPLGIEDVCRDILAIGELAGQDARAAAVVADMKGRIGKVAEAVRNSPRPSVFWELWDDPLMTAGGATFISEAIAEAGGVNIFAELKEEWPMVSLEQLLTRKPDWIMSGNDHGDRLKLASVRSRPLWASMPAVAAGRIATVEADAINRGGPRLADAVEAIARILHPDSFR